MGISNLNIEVTYNETFKQPKLYDFNGLNFDMTLEVVTVERELPFEAHLQNFN